MRDKPLARSVTKQNMINKGFTLPAGASETGCGEAEGGNRIYVLHEWIAGG
ncbi:hypothetical protein AA106556_0247 [Neokomagataea tanensis NBRC 106556]|uniref:Uncharacterized protein n=1 Tax=Neokomagataea tanensis NBRC 106556 TaxID=1223519 RepID=A0ABQ0QGM0_9PROT|nr:hypothetical protein AA106556_0247 [Neokomagataea tanensis NBRC 106556]